MSSIKIIGYDHTGEIRGSGGSVSARRESNYILGDADVGIGDVKAVLLDVVEALVDIHSPDWLHAPIQI
jgi:hypothetical protein